MLNKFLLCSYKMCYNVIIAMQKPKLKIIFEFNKQSGAMLVTALVFVTLFAVLAVALAGMISAQHKAGLKKIKSAQALAVAEAGINYYRWHLAHAPEDYQDGTGEPGPYVHNYKDNVGNNIGKFELEITPPDECSSVVNIQSTGWLNDDPNLTRQIQVKYGKKSLASYAFLTNSNVWFGDDEILHGPLHSNGGIRMDGYNDGQTTSAKQTYICGPEHGCWYQEKPGVWGNGGEQTLWEFPVSNIDFDALTTDLAEFKNLAQNSQCGNVDDCYFQQRGLGYHLVFKTDGTFDMYRVTKLKNPVWGYDGENIVRESDDIDRESFIDNYDIPDSCGIIYVEDDLWVEGTVNGRVSVVAAKLPDSGSNPRIIINNDIEYLEHSNEHTLGLISQSDILVPLYAAPNNLTIEAALMAQKGRVYRKLYYDSGWRRAPWLALPYVKQDQLTLYGSIITNTTWTWTWVGPFGNVISGYENTETIYDPNLTYYPPPSFPTTGEYQILEWEETTEKQ